MSVNETLSQPGELPILNERGLRLPVHPSITEAQISTLVENFYAQIQQDERLGPVFGGNLSGTWDMHLGTMKMFWRSVLLRSGEYKGKPVPVHLKIEGLASEDFTHWLALFRPCAEATFHAEAAPLVIQAAERIAQSLWLSKLGTPFNQPPAGLISV